LKKKEQVEKYVWIETVTYFEKQLYVINFSGSCNLCKMLANLYEKRKLHAIGPFAERFRRKKRLWTDSTPVALPNFVRKRVRRYTLICQLTGKD